MQAQKNVHTHTKEQTILVEANESKWTYLLKFKTRNLLPIRKWNSSSSIGSNRNESNWKMNKRTKTNRIGLFSFKIETNVGKQKLSGFSSFIFSFSMCVCAVVNVCVLKCNYFCSSWCAIHQLLGHRFHFETFPVFLTVSFCGSFRVLHKLLVLFNFRAFIRYRTWAFVGIVFAFLFLYLYLSSSLFRFYMNGEWCEYMCLCPFVLFFVVRNSTNGKTLRLAFNNWVGNFQLLIFIVSLSSSFAHMCAIVHGQK